MNEEQIAYIFQLITSVLAVGGGILFILFRKHIFEAQKRNLLDKTDYLNKSINERLIGMSSRQWNVISIIASLGVIIAGVVRLMTIL